LPFTRRKRRSSNCEQSNSECFSGEPCCHAEVDLILEDRKKQLYGIEIKSTAPVGQNDFKGLKRLAEIAGKKFQRGIVQYSGEHTVGGFGENLLAVPLSAVWSE